MYMLFSCSETAATRCLYMTMMYRTAMQASRLPALLPALITKRSPALTGLLCNTVCVFSLRVHHARTMGYRACALAPYKSRNVAACSNALFRFAYSKNALQHM